MLAYVGILTIAIFICMQWCNQGCKSGKILRIFRYQVRAVTILPPLQESHPEILGLSEEGGVFLTKTSFALPCGFLLGMIGPLDFEELDGVCHSSFSAGIYSYRPYRVVKAVFGMSSFLILI